MSSPKQRRILETGLNPDFVLKVDKGGGIKTSYLEAWFIIDQLNQIIGFERWSYDLAELEPVVKFQTTEWNQKENRDVQYTTIAYRARVRLRVIFATGEEVVREDVGFGQAKRRSPVEAHEGAGKSAVSDALKRAARTLGCQFGNSLYEKENPVHQGGADRWGLPPVGSGGAPPAVPENHSANHSEQPRGHHPSWEKDKRRFFAIISRMSLSYPEVCEIAEREGALRPSHMDAKTRDSFLKWLEDKMMQAASAQAQANREIPNDDDIPF